MEDIDRIHRPSLERFTEDYLVPAKPVVITGAMEDWRALSDWSREYLATTAGSRPVTVRSQAVGDFSISAETGPRYVREEMTFRDLLGHLDKPSERIYYLQGEALEEKLPELLSDIRVPPYVDQRRLTGCRLWFGPGQRVALHYDTPHGMLAMIRGMKRVTLFDPAELPFLYHSPIEGPHASFPYSRVDLEHPDLERFPEFARAHPIEVELHAGEMLFLPAFWWHHVVSCGENVAINFWWMLLPNEKLETLGRTFTAFQDTVRTLPREWRAHIGRMANEFVFNETH